MKLASLLMAAIASLAVVSSASAANSFTFTAPGGTITDDTIGSFALSMGGTVPVIASLELEINGLTHSNPWDLDIILINPFGTSLDILKDRGDQNPVTGIDLLFRDSGAALPVNPDDPLSGSPYSLGAVMPEGIVRIGTTPTGGTGFADAFVGSSGGMDSWILIVSDDTGNAIGGSFDSFTLRGTYVPEPMSLSLLVAGAFAVFGKRKR